MQFLAAGSSSTQPRRQLHPGDGSARRVRLRHHDGARRSALWPHRDGGLSVSAQPPRLLVCVNRSSFTHAKIGEAGVFCVNVLSETQDIVAKAFAGMLGPNVDRFGVAEWTTLRSGAPALVGCAAAFDCTVGERLEQSTHTVFFGDVVGVSSRLGQDTLLYGSRKFRQLRKILLSLEAASGETLHY